MSGVVLRCPNCGTTRAAPGECDACHEAQVRYFCTNHAPGRWLDAPACPDCGARFGGPARPAAAAPPPRIERAPAPPPRPAAAPTSAPRRTTMGGMPWGRRRTSPPPGDRSGTPEEGGAVRDPVTTRLTELLRRGPRVRRAPVEATHFPEAPIDGPIMPGPAAGPATGGCLARALFLVLFLLISFLMMSLLVGGSLFQVIGIYY